MVRVGFSASLLGPGRRFLVNLPSRTRKLLILPFFYVAAIIFACGGGDDPSPTPVDSPTQSPVIVTPGPTSTAPPTGYRLVYREAGATEDVIWSVSPNDVNAKAQLAVIPHREGFPVRAALSPDGTFIAYLTLPDFALGVDSSQAEAYVMDLQLEGAPITKVAEGVDFNYTPMWSPDSALIYMRRYAGPEFLNGSDNHSGAGCAWAGPSSAYTPPDADPGAGHRAVAGAGRHGAAGHRRQCPPLDADRLR